MTARLRCALRLVALALLLAGPAAAAEPPTAPMLRIEPGMHTARIQRISADAHGRYLATVSQDKTARIWSLATGELLSTLRPPAGLGSEGTLSAVAITPNGKIVAVGGSTDSIYLFDQASGRIMSRLRGLPITVLHLAFSPDGRYLAAGLGGDYGVRVFEATTGSLVGEDREISNRVYGLAWHSSAVGFRLAATSLDGKVRLWSFNVTSSKLEKIAETAPSKLSPFGITFSPDGRRLAVGYADSLTVEIVDATTLTRISTLVTTSKSDAVFGDLAYVAWADKPNGSEVWAGGTARQVFSGQVKFILNRWVLQRNGAVGTSSSFAVAEDTVLSIASLPAGQIAFGGGGPHWGLIGANGSIERFTSAPVRDFRFDRSGPLELSANGQILRLGKLAFDLNSRRLNQTSSSELHKPRTGSINGLDVLNWLNNPSPVVKSRPIKLEPYEHSRSLAIASDGQGFALGSTYLLRRFDSKSSEVWRQDVPGDVWAVNLAEEHLSGQPVLVAAYADGTIRWHRWSDGKELLALYAHPDNQRWVLWTPNGYFDASPGAEDLIGWHVNQGKDKEARFVKGGQLYAKLYRPDLIARAAAGEDYASFPVVNLETLLASGDAPKVRFAAPAAGTSASRDVMLKYRVCDAGGGIGQRVLRINGMTVALAEGDRGLKPKSGAFKEDCLDEEKLISLQPGDNTIAVTAFNKAGQIESTPVELKLALLSTVPAGAKPTLHVLALAVDQYRDGELRLTYAKKDAQGLIDSLKQAGGKIFADIKVHTLLDDQVRKAGIGEKFDQLSTQVKPEDVFVLYIAGHGVTEKEDGNYYYLPVDFRYSDAAAVRKQAISNTFFQENLTKIKAGKSLVLLDTCNSGSFSAVKTRGVEEKTAVARLVKATGRATIMASSSSQVALEGYEGHGVFTWALIQGLKGKAAQNNQITVGSLADYVGDTLPELTYKKFGYEQVPQRELQGMNFPIGVR